LGNGQGMAEARKSKDRRAKRPLTATALENSALHYLGRFATSSGNLRRVLLRKVARSAIEEGDRSAGLRLVEELIARYLRSGLLDDRAYAAQAASSLARRGASRHAIGGKLAQKGVAAELVKEALQGLDAGGSSELASACALIRRRRLGPYRAPALRAASRNKDLAALARAGFSLDIARRVLAARDIDALEALARGESSA
jgi:regulatory protein